MRERLKNLFTYFLTLFNLIVGIASIYSIINGLTQNKFLIVASIIAVIGLCVSVAIIVEKVDKPLSDKVSELSEGYVNIAEKYKFESLRLKNCFLNNTEDPKSFQKEVLQSCVDIVIQIKDILRNALGKKVRVCIKMFREDSTDLLFTYCRDNLGSEESIRKEHNQKINVSQNSDFAAIINGNQDFFIGSDLKKDYKEKNITIQQGISNIHLLLSFLYGHRKKILIQEKRSIMIISDFYVWTQRLNIYSLVTKLRCV